MEFTVKLAQTPWVKLLGAHGNRYQLDLAGVSGWCWDSPNGLCIAVAIDKHPIPHSWLRKVSLLLAASDSTLDDSLLLEGGNAWLIHRYPTTIDPVEQEAVLTQQLAVARFLAAHGQSSIATTRPGRQGN